MIDIAPARFEEMVAEALDTVPPGLATVMRNVVVQVADGDVPGLLGLYEGIPLTERTTEYSALPDQITIFRMAVLAVCDTEQQVVDEVRTTVVHEVGHHFGIDDERLNELGY